MLFSDFLHAFVLSAGMLEKGTKSTRISGIDVPSTSQG